MCETDRAARALPIFQCGLLANRAARQQTVLRTRMPNILAANLAPIDWIILAVYFALLVATGIWLSRRQSGTEDYFLAQRRMPAWAVSISVLATSLSAATFLGAPQDAYDGSLAYLSAAIGTIIAALIVARFFIPAYYRHNVTTVYELLEVRFGPAARQAGSWTFMIGRVMASGARIFIAAHALSFIVFGDLATDHLVLAVVVTSLAGVVYTVAGGIATVIWTDVVQTCVFLIAILVAAAYLLAQIPAPVSGVIDALRTAGPNGSSKLTVIDLSADFNRPFTIWTALTGFALLNLAVLGADQDLAQRMLTCRSPVRAGLSVVWSQIIGIPVVLVFMLIGLLLFVRHNLPLVMGDSIVPPPQDSREVFLSFITRDVPPGMAGLLIAGLFAVALASLDSALNAMSSTMVNDVYKRLVPGRAERHYLTVARLGVAFWGVVLGAFACLCIVWQKAGGDESLLQFALRVMVFAYTGLVAVYICALFTRRGNSASVLAALATGAAITALLEPVVIQPILPALEVAFPWRMTIAATGALVVCCLGNPRSTVNRPIR